MKIFNRVIPATVLALIVMAGLGSAGLLTYYGMITGTATIEQSVKVDGESVKESLALSYDASGVAGNTVVDGPHSLTNDADVPATVDFETIYSPDGDGITTEYVGELTLTEKNVDFESDVWTVPGDAETVTVEYTIVGDEFNAEIVENAKTGYKLIYYSDNFDRFNDVAKAIDIDTITENLPYPDDENAEGGDYDYCETGEYVTCHGAKIWYVPEDAVDTDGNIDWSKASEFYYETELIQYNKEGQITIYRIKSSKI